MFRVGLFSSDPKVGTLAQQREVMGQCDKLWPPEAAADCLDYGIREGECLVLPHAKALGRMRQRELYLTDLAARGIYVQVPGRDPMIYDTTEKRAQFHGDARQPTGTPSKKQKKLMGRPRKYPKPTEDQLAKLAVWWDGPQHMDDVQALVTEMLGRKVRRPTLYEWMGRGREPHQDRPRRKPKRRPSK